MAGLDPAIPTRQVAFIRIEIPGISPGMTISVGSELIEVLGDDEDAD
jgi:hypothetical protein